MKSSNSVGELEKASKPTLPSFEHRQLRDSTLQEVGLGEVGSPSKSGVMADIAGPTLSATVGSF
jgi:hypothetical protein